MSLNLPCVSIIVAAYQGIAYLPATIDSILQQTNDSFEILVFSDDFSQIYPWFAREPDARLRFVVQSNLGLAETYNQGVLEARGKYICLVEAGDLWHSSKLQQQIFCLDHYREIGLVFSASISIDQPSKQNIRADKTLPQPLSNWQEIGNWRRKYRLIKLNTDQYFQQLDSWGRPPEILSHNQLPSSSVMLRKTCFKRVGLFDSQIQLIADWDMWIRLSQNYGFMAITEPLVYCRQFLRCRGEQWLALETDLHTIIEKAYALMSVEQQKQKHRSYGYASLFLAEYILQHKDYEPEIAYNYWYQALQHDASIILSLEFCRLQWVIFCLYYLQGDRYDQLRRFTRFMGDQFQSLIYMLGKYSQKAINWMLEEEDNLDFWKNSQAKQQGEDL